MWPDRRLTDLFKIEHPIVLAPMAGAIDHAIAVEVAEGGGLGSIPCAMLNPETARGEIEKFRAGTKKPLNLNFFCHTPPELNNAREAAGASGLRPIIASWASIRPRRSPPATARRSTPRSAT